MKKILFEDCEENWLYLIDARNASLGVFQKEAEGFIIARTKFSNTYLFIEIHYDMSEHHGTATPLLKLEKVPFEVLYKDSIYSDKRLLQWLIEKKEEYKKMIDDLVEERWEAIKERRKRT